MRHMENTGCCREQMQACSMKQVRSKCTWADVGHLDIDNVPIVVMVRWGTNRKGVLSGTAHTLLHWQLQTWRRRDDAIEQLNDLQ